MSIPKEFGEAPAPATGAPEAAAVPVPDPALASKHQLVLKNAAFLVAAQALTTPISILLNFMMGRFLGASDFGLIYLTGTFCSFAFLAVEWGQPGVLPGIIATDRKRAGALLGTAMLWRVGLALLFSTAFPFLSIALGYDRSVANLFAVSIFGLTIGAAMNVCLDAIRGFERTDISAYAQVGAAFLNVIGVTIALLLGANLLIVVAVQGVCNAIVFGFVWRQVRPVGIAKLSVDWGILKTLLARGIPFIWLGAAMALQPNIDALFLSKLVPTDVMGWHAAGRRLVGVLVVPATSIVTALYPTLCRLHVEDREAFRRTTSEALRSTTLLAVPLALGCGLFPEIGVRVFGRESFGPAEQNVRVLSGWLLLLYFSMPLGACILASGRQRLWAGVQALCVLFSAVLDPLLIPYFQRRVQNGGLGVCVATVVSEVFMVALGIALTPKGIFTRALVRQIGASVLAGCAMILVARLLHFTSPFLAAPPALAAYAVAAYLLGAVDPSQVQAVKRKIMSKFGRG